MASQIPGKSLRLNVLGTSVSRAAALLPATTQAAIFTITGGKVLVTSLVGEVVAAMPATTNAVKITGNPTAGTDVDWTSATSTASAEAGSIITPGVTAGGALVVKNAGGGNGLMPYVAYVAQVGTLDLVTTGTAATGTVKWSLTYIPLDDGAAVTAA